MYKLIYSVFCECCGEVTTETRKFRWNAGNKATIRFAEIAAALEATDDLKVGFVAVSYNDNCKIAFSKLENYECFWWFDKDDAGLTVKFYMAYLKLVQQNNEAA